MVAMAAIVGRVNPTDLVKIALVHTTGYTLNEQIIYTAIGGLDAGGGMPVYLYGAYYGLTVNYVLSQYVHPNTRPEKTYYSQVLSLVGTLFLWVFWPTFNFSWSASTSY
jgi:ammonium transporter Rh